MQILLSCAKTMAATTEKETPVATTPHFQKEASEIAFHLSQFSVDELEKLLNVNKKIAVRNYRMFQQFHAGRASLPALLAYNGIVFRRLYPMDFSAEDFLYAQDHLRITSFCYGLLKPLDHICPYRMEGNIRLPEMGNQSMFRFWQPILTDHFIKDIKEHGEGILCNLASDEMKGLFDWKKVEKEVKIVTPEFHNWKNGKLATITIYTKMARGEMTRYIIKNRITDARELKTFAWEGFEYNESLSTDDRMVFTNGIH